MQQEGQLDIEQLYDQIQTLKKSLKEGECVILYGPTGVGKTTIFSYINGYTMEIVNNYQIDILGRQKHHPQIGHGVIAQTTQPNIQVKNNIFVVDLPGYDDNRSSQQRIINAIINHEIFRFYKKIRFILILDFRAILIRSALNIKELINGIYMSLGQFGSDLVSNIGIIINYCKSDCDIQSQYIERYLTFFKSNIKDSDILQVSQYTSQKVQIWQQLSDKEIQSSHENYYKCLDDNQSYTIFLQILRRASFFTINEATSQNNPYTDQMRDKLFDWIKQLRPIQGFSIKPNISTDDQTYLDHQLSIYTNHVVQIINKNIEEQIQYWNQLLSLGIGHLEGAKESIELWLAQILQGNFYDIYKWVILTNIAQNYSKIQIDLKETYQYKQTLVNYLDQISSNQQTFLFNLLQQQKESRELIASNLIYLENINNFIVNQQLDIQNCIDEVLSCLNKYEQLVNDNNGTINLKCAKLLQQKQNQDFITSKVIELNKLLNQVQEYDESIIKQFSFEQILDNIDQAQKQLMKASKIFKIHKGGQEQRQKLNDLQVQFIQNTSEIHSFFKIIKPYLNLLQQILSNTFYQNQRNLSEENISLIAKDYINIIIIKNRLQSTLNCSVVEL